MFVELLTLNHEVFHMQKYSNFGMRLF